MKPFRGFGRKPLFSMKIFFRRGTRSDVDVKEHLATQKPSLQLAGLNAAIDTSDSASMITAPLAEQASFVARIAAAAQNSMRCADQTASSQGKGRG